MTTTEPNTELSLAQKTVSNIKIETLLPEITLTLSLEDFTDFSKAAKLEVRKSTAVIFKEKIENQIAEFEKDNSSLAQNERYSDTYYYRLSAYYKLLGDFENERKCLEKIQSNANVFFEEQKAKNRLAAQSIKNLYGTKKVSPDILKPKTAETVRIISCVQLAAGDYIGANKMIESFLESQDDETEENYELLCQYGLTFVLLNDLRKAVHTFRYVFYNIENTSDVALMLAYLYRALLNQEKSKKRKCALYKKTVFWLKNAACLNPASKQVADFFYKTAFKTETEYFTRFMEKFVKFASTKKDKEYFVDSMNILGNCYFEQNRFADCIEVLQEICTQDYFSAGIWSNIALCNIRMNKSDRALKNAEKSYLKLKETDGKRLKHNVSSIYMDLLCKAKKYDAALKVFEEKFGVTFVPSNKKEFLDVCDLFLRILIEKKEFSHAAEYAEFLWQCTSNADTEEMAEVKVCILNTKIRLFADISYNPEILLDCSFELEKLFYEYRKTHKDLPLFFNNLVYSRLEGGGNLDGGILDIFLSNVTANCYLCATFGLYQARIKNNAEKCAHYYNKATELVTAADFECRSNLAEELHLKCDLELFRLYEKFGSPREAERIKARIIKKCPEELWFYREAVRGEGEE